MCPSTFALTDGEVRSQRASTGYTPITTRPTLAISVRQNSGGCLKAYITASFLQVIGHATGLNNTPMVPPGVVVRPAFLNSDPRRCFPPIPAPTAGNPG